jgi:hypothetical protein
MNKAHYFWSGLVSILMLAGCGKTTSEEVVQWPMAGECDLHQSSCSVQQGDASATLTIRPHPIPTAKPLDIEVQLQNLPARQVQLDISGMNMYMGYNRVTLNASAPGHFTGRSMLAFCTTDKMQWQITLMVDQPDGTQVQIPFYLETRNR